MWNKPLSVLDPALAIQADRLAEAERRRQAIMARRTADPPTPRMPYGGPATRRYLAYWLATTGERLACLGPDELTGRRQDVRAVIDELLAAGQDAGLDLNLQLEGNEDPIVLQRALAWLAGRTAGSSIPLSRTRRRQLARSFRRLSFETGADRVESPTELPKAA